MTQSIQPYVAGITERLLRDAGIAPGMRVLDIGCGRGDVSLLAASLVGATGHVLGVDRDAEAIAVARSRAGDLRCTHADFAAEDISALPETLGPFDAIVGRRVLMYQPDPVATVQSVCRLLRAGGLLVLQEHDATMVPGRRVPLPLHERVNRWMWDTVQRDGGTPHMGFDLHAVLSRAGLLVEHVRAEAIVQTPTAHHDVTAMFRANLPRVVRHGIATEAEIGVDTLHDRLVEERVTAGATYIGDMAFGAWARKAA
ncbi:MAG: methyltransferase domain-containing protein [Hyphomicrobiaceae bacterium]|nr:methyltransferase domain-containing protein [Hyphomicrobiaceae bacterium]